MDTGTYGGGYQAPGTPSPTSRESFLQRQKRVYERPQRQQMGAAPASAPVPATAPPPSTTSGSSPVSADGRIAPAAAPAPPAPAPMGSAPQNTGFTGIGQGAPAPAPAQHAATTTAPAAPAPAPPQTGAAPAPQPGATPPPVPPPPAPPEAVTAQNDMRGNMLEYLMANPYSMSNENVSQLQAQQREQAATMAQQAQQQMRSGMAAAGRLDSGYAAGQDRRMNDSLMSSVLGGNRDIALQKMKQDQEDIYNVLGQANTSRQGDQQDRSWELQRELGLGGLQMDQQRLGEQGREFNLGHGLDLSKFFENQRQYDTGLTEQQRQYNGTNALNWSQLNSQNQNNMMNWFRSLYGGGA